MGAAAAVMVAARAAVASVTVTRLEGPVREMDRPVTHTGPDALERAEATLRGWAHSAPKGGAYDKCRAVIAWTDGETYEARYDLHHPSYERVDLGRHVRETVGLTAGTWRPAGWTEARHRSYLAAAEIGPDLQAEARRFLETHAL